MHVRIVAHVLFTKYLQIYKSDHPHCDFWKINRLAYMLKKQHENHMSNVQMNCALSYNYSFLFNLLFVLIKTLPFCKLYGPY